MDGDIVLYGRNAGDARGARGGKVLFGFGRNRTLEGDFSVSENDVDQGNFLRGVTLQSGILENGAVNGAARIVIGGRFGKHFNQVLNGEDPLETLYGRLCVGPERGTQDVTSKGDFAAVESESDVVEDGIVGKNEELVADFVMELAFLGPRCGRGKFFFGRTLRTQKR